MFQHLATIFESEYETVFVAQLADASLCNPRLAEGLSEGILERGYRPQAASQTEKVKAGQASR
jgi:hypothetical protein